MARHAKHSNQRGKRMWLSSGQPGRLVPQAGGVGQQEARGRKAEATRFLVAGPLLEVGCSRGVEGRQGLIPSQMALARVTKTMSFGLRHTCFES